MGLFDNYKNSSLSPTNPNKPYTNYDIEGNKIGYWWYYGDYVNLEFIINGEITFEGNDKFVTIEDFLKDKKAQIQFFNFRNEIVFETIINLLELSKPNVVLIEIDNELSKKFIKGNYTCKLTIFNQLYRQTIFDNESGILSVK